MLRTFFATGISICFLSSSSSGKAESTTDVLEAFGLPGTWSADCSKDLKTEFGYRIYVMAPPLGPATIKAIDRSQAGTMTVFLNVQSAVRVSEDRIELIVVRDHMEASDPKLVPVGSVDKTPVQNLFEKIGGKLRLIDSETTDGKIVFYQNGRNVGTADATPLLERCSD